MLVNLSHGPNLSAANKRLPFWLYFDNTTNSILELDRTTGKTRTIPLSNHILNVTLLGGSGRLYKYDNGPFAPYLTVQSVNTIDIAETSASVHFVFNQKAQAQIEYGKDANYGRWSIKEQSFNYSTHQQLLSNLSRGTIYHYRIHGWDALGHEIVSKDRQFTTLGVFLSNSNSEIDGSTSTATDSGTGNEGALLKNSPSEDGLEAGCSYSADLDHSGTGWFALILISLFAWRRRKRSLKQKV